MDSSHEIDYLRWLFGEPEYIQSDFVQVSHLKTDVDGIANVIAKFPNNILTSIHVDFVRRQYRRTLEVICENGIINWSLQDGTVRVFSSSKNKWNTKKLENDVNDMYIRELKHVINSVKTNTNSTIIDLENGVKSFYISKLILSSAISGKRSRNTKRSF